MALLAAGSLHSCFTLIAYKRVRESEVDPQKSNSHEFNGTKLLKEFLGLTPPGFYKKLTCRFLYFSDDSEVPLGSDGFLTWYKPHRDPERKEWRLYYEDNAIVGRESRAAAGDLMVLAFAPTAPGAPDLPKKEQRPPPAAPHVWAIFAQAGSIVESEIVRLFGVGASDEQLQLQEAPAADVDFVGRQLLDALGIELALPKEWDAVLLERFGPQMPSVVEFSNFARSTLDLDLAGKPDASLVAWWEREDLLFRIHARALLRRPIEQEFERWRRAGEIDVDAIRAVVMSSTQTARSRAGAAFENHLATIFRACGLRFAARRRTSSGDIPDFLFPGVQEYETSPHVEALTMLAAKTTCKERWQQVLAEAPRIARRHLATMSGDLPPDQLQRMRDSNLTLVLPAARHSTLPPGTTGVMALREFIEMVREREKIFR
jgi:hypothetical protein